LDKNNIPTQSVVTYDDSLYILSAGHSEVVLSITTNRFILYDIINIFSDLKHEDIFNRFILKTKLLGLSKAELEKYINDIIEHNKCYVVCVGKFWSVYALLFFGEPQNFKFPRGQDAGEVIDDFVEVALRYYQDERYFEDLLKRYKVDYVVRKKPYQGEWYLKEEAKIGEFYIFRVLKE